MGSPVLGRVWVRLERIVFFGALLLLFTGEGPSLSPVTQLDRIVGGDRFDFLAWLSAAFAEKGEQGLVPLQNYLDDRQRARFVVEYLDLTRQLLAAEDEVDRLYADPSIADPGAVSADRRAERDRLRAEAERRRPTAEAIIEAQITAMLADEGMALGGRVFPPVQARITPLPSILIISPRDEIKREPGVSLSAGLSIERSEQIESSVLAELNQSALVTSIGGLAVYPSMIVETGDLLFLLRTVSHEWVHHWLFFRPLGIQLLVNAVSGGDTLTINETVAALAGDELGALVLKRFYLEIARRDYAWVYESLEPDESPEAAAPNEEAGAFNFNREMHLTRVRVDEYLATARELEAKAVEVEADRQAGASHLLRLEALGFIVKAERYMEDRRKIFIEKGYWWIRKLNQAYFAFYGSYADQPGASGADPIGPAVRDLRRKLPRVSDFLDAVAPLTTLEDLRRVLSQYP